MYQSYLEYFRNSLHVACCFISIFLQTLTANGQTMSSISPEMRKAFDKWYEEQLKAYTERNGSTAAGGMNLTSAAKELLAIQQERFNMVMSASQKDPVSGQEKAKSLSPLSQVSPSTPRPMASSTPTERFHTSHPAFQLQFIPGKTRMRTSFDPENEIPRLQKWFVDNQHPSREQMLHYLSVLNSLESRKGRRPLDLTNIIYWFKNARAAHRRAAKSSEEDSFEMDEDKDMQTTTSESMPFLPNRNAVYMVPYPHYPPINLTSALGHGDFHGRYNSQTSDREPCDLSMNGRSNPTRSPSPSHINGQNTVSPRGIDEHDGASNLANQQVDDVSNDKQEAHIQDGHNSEGESKTTEDPHYIEEQDKEKPAIDCNSSTELVIADETINRETVTESDLPTDLTTEKTRDVSDNHESPKDLSLDKPCDLTVNKNIDKPCDLSCNKQKILTNGKRPYESDDDVESDYDDDDRSIDGSISSHDEGKMSSLRDSYLSVARGLNFNPVTSSPSSQPLHIPQFPHPLAMHYFPLNTHLYSQQANQIKFHQSSQQSSPKSSPGQGQENNSHRKRRTRVFIDPLSEIPKLEKWFLDDTHPSSYMIDKYCEELNNSEYRQKFPKLEPKNVQLWFKNHRAKVKRMRLGTVGDSIIFN